MFRLRLLEKLRVPLMLLPAFLVLILLFGGGLAVGVGQSFGYFPVIGLTDLTFEHYVSVLTDRNFLQSLWLTFRIAFWSTFLSSDISFPGAIADSTPCGGEWCCITHHPEWSTSSYRCNNGVNGGSSRFSSNGL